MLMTPHADMGPSKWVLQERWLAGWLAGRLACQAIAQPAAPGAQQAGRGSHQSGG